MDENGANLDTGHDGPPSWFGRFRVIAPLARGGMGLVYLVQDETGREAVIKTIRPDLASDPAYRARFRNEAQAAVRFRSTLVARVWDCDASAATPWIALEKIDGPTLREVVLNGHAFEHVALAAFAADLAEGVHAFYDQGMAHGDLTPSNIVIQDGNRLKVLDLGLARPTADETATGDLPAMGTPYWLAPEVAAGFAPDNLSDVNQWGKLVLFAGTGYPQQGPASLRDALLDLPFPLRAIVERTLAPVPDARPTPDELWKTTRERRLSGHHPPALELVKSLLILQPGHETETSATVTNQSSDEEVYRLEVLGPLAWAGHAEPPTLTVKAGAHGQARVRFRLPDTSSVTPRDWPFGIRCAVQSDPQRAAVVEGSVTVFASSRIHIEPLAQSPRGKWLGRYRFGVQNRGNTAAKVRIAADETDNQLSFAVSPPSLDLGPGEVASGRVRVRTRRPFLSGGTLDHRFRVSVSSQSPGEATVPTSDFLDLMFHQVPVVSRKRGWLVLAVVAGVALIAGLVLLIGHLNAGS